ncbi:coiled-coil domain-containing protein 187 isoform X4 [Parambassis ranga]|uniref:Coiled-coil domain-containing protein 187 isoform X4 n=1 Tax=Parambassis ranga TaxID=210632 RepID=A0A6P7IJU3_9TELE|nr:coiled-coil domain-containing protein 50-like isoform X4 [Parambassis ranga]
MAELEIDQSNLPRVQEVNPEASHLFSSSMTASSASPAMCQSFAVLEDGVLAHSLQEQEIEQYYTTNVQKNQLVQNDIRVAKRLQDEEEELRSQQSALLRQTSRQIEQQDFEYALLIQEEIQRCAEENLRREQGDEEIAKRLQEEEEQRIRRRSRGQEGPREDPSLQPEPETSLDLRELQQVLLDEELARKLQEEEETQQMRSSQPVPCRSHPGGDFRVAQVAQDEEIARFMQKQEIKTKRRSRELDGPASWREHRAMINHHDRRAARERQVQRERLDSEGLPSPTEDFSPDNQPPSPISTIPQTQQVRNIAEELDPTFQARRLSTESLRAGQTGPTAQTAPYSGLHDLLEEPTFIPPTKRQAEKSGRSKPKEKKENCKQQ